MEYMIMADGLIQADNLSYDEAIEMALNDFTFTEFEIYESKDGVHFSKIHPILIQY